jgi:hypothetical protein
VLKLAALATELRDIVRRGGGFGSDTEQALLVLADTLELRAGATLDDLKKLVTPKLKKPPKATSFEGSGSDVISEYVSLLDGRSSSTEGLDILARMDNDSRVKRPELFEIAGRVVGAKLAFRNRGEALSAIKDRVTRRDWDQGALDILANRTKR